MFSIALCFLSPPPPPRAYPLPLEYLLSSSLFAIQTKRRSKRPRTPEVIIDF